MAITRFINSRSYFFPSIVNVGSSLFFPVIALLTSLPILSVKSLICFLMSPTILFSFIATAESHIGHVAFPPTSLVVLKTL